MQNYPNNRYDVSTFIYLFLLLFYLFTLVTSAEVTRALLPKLALSYYTHFDA